MLQKSRREHYPNFTIPTIIIRFGKCYYCPHCGANLDSQEGFSPDLEVWMCKECYQVLYGDIYDGEKYPDTIWFCNGCGALLNQQEGFCDTVPEWKCLNCGTVEKFDTIFEFQTTPQKGTKN